MPIWGGFCLFGKFIRATAATIKYESDAVLAAVYQKLFFMNRDVPNMSYMMTHTDIWQHVHACLCLQ